MDDNSTIDPSHTSGSGLAALGALLPGVGIASQPPPMMANGQVTSRGQNLNRDQLNDKKVKEAYGSEEEEEEEEVDTTKIQDDPRAIFRISDIGSSESSSGHAGRPIIRIQDEDGTGEGSPLFSSKKHVEERRRQKELAGTSMPPFEPHKSLLAADGSRSRGTSAGPGYGTFGVTIQDESERSRSPSPTRKPIRKTISGECLFSRLFVYSFIVCLFIHCLFMHVDVVMCTLVCINSCKISKQAYPSQIFFHLNQYKIIKPLSVCIKT